MGLFALSLALDPCSSDEVTIPALNPDDWTVGGASTWSAESFGSVDLTSRSAPGTDGYVFYRTPVALAGTSWSVELAFRAQGPFSDSGEGEGDGLAFWFTRQPPHDVPAGRRTVFGNRGAWDGLGVFFDTRRMGAPRGHGTVSGVINAGGFEWNPNEARASADFASCAREALRGREQTRARVRYDAAVGQVTVTLRRARAPPGKGWDDKPCFVLRNVPKTLGEGEHYFGATAAASAVGQDVFALDELAVTAQGGGLEAALADFYADAALTEAEAAQIDALAGNPKLAEVVKAQHAEHASRLNALHDHLERKLKEVEEHVSHLIAAVQAAEQLMDNRLQALEADAKRSVQDFSESHLPHRHNWRGPFLGLFVLCAGIAVVGYRKYMYIVKTHLP
jgi:hypothetical protein